MLERISILKLVLFADREFAGYEVKCATPRGLESLALDVFGLDQKLTAFLTKIISWKPGI